MTETPDEIDVPVVAGLADLVARARQGDREVLPALRAYLDDHPEVWRVVGDLAVQAREIWLDLVAGSDMLLAESIRKKMDDMRLELAGPSPTPLESLLVERILVTWLQVSHADAMAGQARGPGATAAVRQELAKRQESAQRRYLASVKQLAVVRRLGAGQLGRPVLRIAGTG